METEMTIISIVKHGKGYRCVAEYDKPISMFPHYKTMTIAVNGDTIEDVLERIRRVAK